MSDGIKKNFRIVRAQWRDYREEVQYINDQVVDAIRAKRVIPFFQKKNAWHHSFAYLEEAVDKMPRLTSYLIFVWALVSLWRGW